MNYPTVVIGSHPTLQLHIMYICVIWVNHANMLWTTQPLWLVLSLLYKLCTVCVIWVNHASMLWTTQKLWLVLSLLYILCTVCVQYYELTMLACYELPNSCDWFSPYSTYYVHCTVCVIWVNHAGMLWTTQQLWLVLSLLYKLCTVCVIWVNHAGILWTTQQLWLLYILCAYVLYVHELTMLAYCELPNICDWFSPCFTYSTMYICVIWVNHASMLWTTQQLWLVLTLLYNYILCTYVWYELTMLTCYELPNRCDWFSPCSTNYVQYVWYELTMLAYCELPNSCDCSTYYVHMCYMSMS